MTPYTPTSRPIIGLTTYHKKITGASPMSLIATTPAYVDAVAAAGGAPLLIPLGLDEDALRPLLDLLDGLVLTGGGDIAGEEYHSRHAGLILDVDPDRDRIELFLAREFVAREKPLLGICRGHQLLNVALGGTLYEDVGKLMPGAIKHDYFEVRPRNYLAHAVEIEPESSLAALLTRRAIRVNSLHHQGIRDLAPDLAASAHAPDGLIEGVEVAGHPFAVGVQWHPENLVGDEPAMRGLFRGLIEAAERSTLAYDR